MESLKHMKKMLTAAIEHQMTNLDCVDAKELGEAVDMLKDLEEAIYYCSITKAMEENSHNMNMQQQQQPSSMHYFSEMNYPHTYNTTTGMRTSYPSGNEMRTTYQSEGMRDPREGRSPTTRKMYMESKELHHDKMTQLKDLEKYMQELSTDITEMIEDASIEERQLLQKKLSTLASKVING